MQISYSLLALFLCEVLLVGQGLPALRGVVTDPSGALIPNALVQLRGPNGEQRRTTTNDGQYSFAPLRPGRYTIRYIARGFSVTEKRAVEINAPLVIDVQLSIG